MIITNQVIRPAALPGNSDKESEPVSQEEGKPVSQQENEAVSQQENEAVSQQENEAVSQQKNEAASQQVNEVDGETIQAKVCQALEKVKQLSEEASRHITRAKAMYKPMEGIFNIRSSGCKPKSWEFTTWDNLVAWVGTYVEQLANWSCDQVRADIVKRGDKAQWTASFDSFYLTRREPLQQLFCHSA